MPSAPTFSALLLAATFVSSPAIAGPFGFDMGSQTNPASQYDYCEKMGDDILNIKCSSAPRPHPDMEYYLISYVEGKGVCGVVGSSKNVNDDELGYKTRELADAMAQQVMTKYGENTGKTDRNYGRTYRMPDEWLAAVDAGDRVYEYTWDYPNPIDGVNSINLTVNAVHSSTGWVSAAFRTPYFEDCLLAKEEEKAAAF